MLDTSHKNALFQAEFGTDLQLADIMRFVKERFDLAEIMADMGVDERQIVEAVVEINKQHKVAEELYQRGYITQQ